MRVEGGCGVSKVVYRKVDIIVSIEEEEEEEGRRRRLNTLARPRRIFATAYAVSYTHLTLPTKRIV